MKFKSPIEVQAGISDGDPTNPLGQAGYLLSSDGSNVNWISPGGLSAETAEAIVQPIKANEALSKGDPVYIVGFQNGQNVNIVAKADSSDVAKMPVVGLVDDDYANQAFGTMTAFGSFNGAFDTTGGTENWAVGDIIFVKPGGGLTNIKPGGTDLIQNVAIVSRVQQNTGELEVIALGRTNDVPNLPAGRLFVGTAGVTSLLSDVVYIDDTNDRVGIGTTNPSEKLEIAGDVNIQGADSGNAGVLHFGNDSDQVKIAGFDSGGSSVQNSLLFYTNTTERMRINSSGNVGIGTISPSAKLDVNGQGNFSDFLNVNSSTGIRSTGWLHLHRYGISTNVAVGNNGTDVNLYVPNGNVGIGTTTPSASLSIDKTNVNQHRALDLENDSITYSMYVDQDNIGTDSWSLFDTTNSQTALRYLPSASGYWQFYTNNTERMRINSSGNVGIGTTSPSEKLEVVGNAILDNSNAKLKIKAGGTGTVGSIDFTFNTDSTQYGLIDLNYNSRASQGLRIKSVYPMTLDAVTAQKFLISGSEKMRIISSGNVGIGTSSPSAKLEVKGSGTSPIVYFGNGVDNAPNRQLAFSGGSSGLVYDLNATGASGVGGQLTLSTNGSERMRIGSAGQIGIGGANYGASGQVLTSNGSSSAPSWQTPTTGDITGVTAGSYMTGGGTSGTVTLNANASSNATANTLAARDSAGDVNVRLLRANYANQSTISGAMAFRVNNSSDNYTRYCSSPSAIRTFIGAGNYNDIRSLGAPAFTNGANPNITTAQVMSEIESDGGFDSYSSVFKTSWSYAGNYNLTDAGDFTETAGSSWITWTDNSSDSTRGNITALAIAPNTGGSAGGVFIYNDQGYSYSPGWRQVWTSTTDGSGSGLDADLLDGQHGSYYADTLSTVLARGNTTTTGASFYGNGIIAQNNSSAGGYHSNGYIVGVASSYGKPALYLHGNGFINTSTIEYGYANTGLLFKKTSNITANAIIFGDHNGNGQGSISVGTSSTTYNTTSDYRLKENVIEITDGIERVKQLQPKRFNFISEPDVVVDGFIAHETQEVVPEAVTGEKDAMQEVVITPREFDDEGNVITEAVMGTKESYQGIDQSKIVPLLTAALKEAIAKIEDLEARVAALEP